MVLDYTGGHQISTCPFFEEPAEAATRDVTGTGGIHLHLSKPCSHKHNNHRNRGKAFLPAPMADGPLLQMKMRIN